MAERGAAPAELRVCLLGEFRLLYGEALVTSVNTPRLQALLAYLILHRHAPQARRHLAFLFWPESTETQARTNLRHLFHQLLQALPDGACYLLADTQTLQWRSEGLCTLDVSDFEAAGAASSWSDLRRAAELYTGDLLPNCYDDWITPERERLHRACTAALERLIARAEDNGDTPSAINYALRLLAHEPCYEATYRSLMRLYAQNGDRAAALHAYHTCVTVLRRELGVTPDAATRALHECLLDVQATVAIPESQAARAAFPLVGRTREWTQLQAIWHSAATGRPQMALIAGDAGIGKTRLAEELESWAARQGILTARARSYAAEGELPYAPVAAWLRARPLPALAPVWLSELARLLPEALAGHPALKPPEPLREAWQRNRLFEALARGVLCCQRPRLLVLDDLQWCDPDTLAWLHYLLRFAPHAALLLVGTLRTGESERPELDALLAALRRDGLVGEIELGPLDAGETAALAGHVAGRVLNPAFVELLFRGSEGNPLFVVEMVQAGFARRDDSIRAAWLAEHATTLGATPQPLPRKVQQVLERRLAQLSPAARELAELASTIGREFAFDVLRAASDLTDDALVRSLDELWQRRILREQAAGAYDFSHDKLREVAYTGLSAARRRLLHRRAAQGLTTLHAGDLDAISGQIGHHYEQAGLFEPAVAHYCRAAEAAQRVYAHADAIQHYRRALVLLGDSASEDRARAGILWERLGDALQFTAQFEPARAAYRQALSQSDILDPVRRSGLLRKLGNAWRESGRYEGARQAYDEALESLSDQPADGLAPGEPEAASRRWHEWIELQLDRIHLQYWQNQVPEAVDLLQALRLLVEQHGTTFQRVRFFIWSALILLRRARFRPSETTASDLRLAQAAARESTCVEDVPAIIFQLGFLLLWHDELADAGERLVTALCQAERSGDLVLQARCLTYLTVIARRLGREEEVGHRTAQLLEVAAAAHKPEFVAAARANQAWLALRHDQLDDALAHGRAALDLWAGLPFNYGFQWLALWPLMAAALRRNQLVQAVEHARSLLHPSQQHLPDAVSAELVAGDASIVAGRTSRARSHLETAISLAKAEGQF